MESRNLLATNSTLDHQDVLVSNQLRPGRAIDMASTVEVDLVAIVTAATRLHLNLSGRGVPLSRRSTCDRPYLG